MANKQIDNMRFPGFQPMYDVPAAYSEPVTVTMGEGGKFSTLNAALEEASKQYPVYKASGLPVTVLIKSGTLISEQITVVGVDLSYITIKAEDDMVYVNGESFTSQGLDEHDLRENSGALFGGENGAGLPTIGCKFQLLAVGQESPLTRTAVPTEDYPKVVGYFANRGSHGVVLSDCGFDHFYDGVIANNESSVTIREGIATNARRYGVHARHNGEISARSCDLSGAQSYAAYADRVANLDVREATIQNCADYALLACHGSVICAAGAHINNCAHAAKANSAAVIDATMMYDLSDISGTAFYVSFDGKIDVSYAGIYDRVDMDTQTIDLSGFSNVPLNSKGPMGEITAVYLAMQFTQDGKTYTQYLPLEEARAYGMIVNGGAHLYISSAGKDSSDGTKDAPLKTLATAFAYWIPYDLGGWDCTVELLSDITANAPTELLYRTNGTVRLVGNDHTITSSNTLKSTRFRTDGELSGLLFAGVHLVLQDIRVTVTASGAHAISCWDGCVVDFQSAHTDATQPSVYLTVNGGIGLKLERGCTSGSCGSEQNITVTSSTSSASGTGIIVKHASYLISGGSVNISNMGTGINCTGGIVSMKQAPTCTSVNTTYSMTKGGRIFVGNASAVS